MTLALTTIVWLLQMPKRINQVYVFKLVKQSEIFPYKFWKWIIYVRDRHFGRFNLTKIEFPKGSMVLSLPNAISSQKIVAMHQYTSTDTADLVWQQQQLCQEKKKLRCGFVKKYLSKGLSSCQLSTLRWTKSPTLDTLSVPKPIYGSRTPVPTRLSPMESETNEGTYLLWTSNKHFAYIVMSDQ